MPKSNAQVTNWAAMNVQRALQYITPHIGHVSRPFLLSVRRIHQSGPLFYTLEGRNAFPPIASKVDEIFKEFTATKTPLEVFLTRYLRRNSSIQPQDQLLLRQQLYDRLQWNGLYEFLENDRKQQKIQNPLDYLDQEDIPMHTRLSFPQRYYRAICDAYGGEKATEICLASNTRAPKTIRVNFLKTSRQALVDAWLGKLQATPCKSSPHGLEVLSTTDLYGLEEFNKGFFEQQDEASQLVAGLVEATPGQRVLDYCAGAGGKSLAIAMGMGHKGQIYLHDARPMVLREARKRLKRAGVQNAQFLTTENPQKKTYIEQLRGKMDWVLVDVPCSGSGTLRRNPDLKWKFKFDTLESLIQKQREIVHEAILYKKRSGKLVYVTCSIFPEENQKQCEFFQQKYDLEVVKQFHSLPTEGGMDGFYGVVLQPTPRQVPKQ